MHATKTSCYQALIALTPVFKCHSVAEIGLLTFKSLISPQPSVWCSLLQRVGVPRGTVPTSDTTVALGPSVLDELLFKS